MVATIEIRRLSLAAVGHTGPSASRRARVVAALRGTIAIVINRDLIALRFRAGSGRGRLPGECDGHSEDGHGGGESKANLGLHETSFSQCAPTRRPAR